MPERLIPHVGAHASINGRQCNELCIPISMVLWFYIPLHPQPQHQRLRLPCLIPNPTKTASGHAITDELALCAKWVEERRGRAAGKSIGIPIIIHATTVWVCNQQSRSTQPSTLRGMVKLVSAFGLSNNKWQRWMQLPNRLQAGQWLKSIGLVQRLAAVYSAVLHSSRELMQRL